MQRPNRSYLLQNLAYFNGRGLIKVNKLMPSGTVSLHGRSWFDFAKTLNSHSASLCPGVKTDSGKFNAGVGGGWVNLK